MCKVKGKGQRAKAGGMGSEIKSTRFRTRSETTNADPGG